MPPPISFPCQEDRGHPQGQDRQQGVRGGRGNGAGERARRARRTKTEHKQNSGSACSTMKLRFRGFRSCSAASWSMRDHWARRLPAGRPTAEGSRNSLYVLKGDSNLSGPGKIGRWDSPVPLPSVLQRTLTMGPGESNVSLSPCGRSGRGFLG